MSYIVLIGIEGYFKKLKMVCYYNSIFYIKSQIEVQCSKEIIAYFQVWIILAKDWTTFI